MITRGTPWLRKPPYDLLTQTGGYHEHLIYSNMSLGNPGKPCVVFNSGRNGHMCNFYWLHVFEPCLYRYWWIGTNVSYLQIVLRFLTSCWAHSFKLILWPAASTSDLWLFNGLTKTRQRWPLWPTSFRNPTRSMTKDKHPQSTWLHNHLHSASTAKVVLWDGTQRNTTNAECHYTYWLVVYLPLWKMMEFVSWDYDIPNIWKVIKIMFQTTNQTYQESRVWLSGTTKSEALPSLGLISRRWAAGMFQSHSWIASFLSISSRGKIRLSSLSILSQWLRYIYIYNYIYIYMYQIPFLKAFQPTNIYPCPSLSYLVTSIQPCPA